jgi:hypothetical protein
MWCFYIDRCAIYTDNVNMSDSNTHHKKSTITVLIVLLALFAGGTAGILQNLSDGAQAPQNKSVAAETKVKAATIVTFTAAPDKTVLEQLQAREKVTIKQDPQYGAFVESINGLKSGTDNKYWSYYVNGQMANIGAGEYKTAGSEEIVWKFE